LPALATFGRMPHPRSTRRDQPTPLAQISRKLAGAVDALELGRRVPYVYDPLVYARVPHELYLDRWGQGQKRVLLVGMNPGPFGMAQTGVPFGDVPSVRDFLGIEGPVEHPEHEHPARPIEGFACPRREVSGSRLWGWVENRFRTPAAFFERFFVVNYCPLVFMEEGGRNLTPDKLPKKASGPLFAACDEALASQVELLRPDWVIGVGGFAERRAREALSGAVQNIGTILHPSPASPAANRGWAEQVEKQLRTLGLLVDY
jgi:single-strand selective monofunctional uracil DNA glycosylase